MSKIAFIDVQNTETTAIKWLGFSVDWQRLTDYLRNEWGCERVHYYLGIQEGDVSRAREFDALSSAQVIVRPKSYFVHKVSDKIVKTTCPKCEDKVAIRVDMGYSWKCNCDVELTVDVLDHAIEGNEIVLFSGDGDFEFLLDKALSRGATVSIVTTAKPRVIAGKKVYRSARKLKEMTRNNSVRILEIDNLKKKIESSIIDS